MTETEKTTATGGPTPERKAHGWWRDAAFITALGSLVLGGATYFRTHLDGKRLETEVQLQKEKQLHAMRQEYLDRAIDPQRNVDYRISVLNFLVTSFGKRDPMGKWASEELYRLQSQIRESARKQESVKRPPGSGIKRPPDRSSTEGRVTEGILIPRDLPRDVCCIPCNGITICGKTVTTDCGSCTAG